MSGFCPEGVGTCADAEAGPCVVGHPCALNPGRPGFDPRPWQDRLDDVVLGFDGTRQGPLTHFVMGPDGRIRVQTSGPHAPTFDYRAWQREHAARALDLAPVFLEDDGLVWQITTLQQTGPST